MAKKYWTWEDFTGLARQLVKIVGIHSESYDEDQLLRAAILGMGWTDVELKDFTPARLQKLELAYDETRAIGLARVASAGASAEKAPPLRRPAEMAAEVVTAAAKNGIPVELLVKAQVQNVVEALMAEQRESLVGLLNAQLTGFAKLLDLQEARNNEALRALEVRMCSVWGVSLDDLPAAPTPAGPLPVEEVRTRVQAEKAKLPRVLVAGVQTQQRDEATRRLAAAGLLDRVNIDWSNVTASITKLERTYDLAVVVRDVMPKIGFEVCEKHAKKTIKVQGIGTSSLCRELIDGVTALVSEKKNAEIRLRQTR